jgi:acetolactate synthase-1/2/3 large subunit
MKYSDAVGDWLVELGYTTCFFVAGGSIMHAIESFRHRFAMRPTVHEVCAGIAAEYFNEISVDGKAFALVTAGPGITNILTAIAGAHLESRELLVIAGQVKTADLKRGALRQRGIQEIDGVAIAAAVTKAAVRLDEVAPKQEWERLVDLTRTGRRGPVVVEFPLDVQGSPAFESAARWSPASALAAQGSPASESAARWSPASATSTAGRSPAMAAPLLSDAAIRSVAQGLKLAARPAILIGGGVDRSTARALRPRLAAIGIPLMTTWNGADRVPETHPLYFGRPNTWGQRYANLIIQQCDELLVLGSRLGLQQTGYNWQEFASRARITQLDLDPAELTKGHPKVAVALVGDANDALRRLCEFELGEHDAWVRYCTRIREKVPLIEPANLTSQGYLSPYVLISELSDLCRDDDVIIPCSSGGAFTVPQQAFRMRESQLTVTNKGLASMGYGLSGAIGAASAYPNRRTILFEGDGGFAQNLQEIGTAVANRLNLKIFIFDNEGYASIRMTQKNYFNGGYVGCDTKTGVGLPQWQHIFAAYGVATFGVVPGFAQDPAFRDAFNAPGVSAFLVRIDPEQTYFPKISSRVRPDGSMESEPLHRMSPPLDAALLAEVGVYLPPD